MRSRFVSGLIAAVLAGALAVPSVTHADDAWLGVTLQALDGALREALDLDDREGVLIADVASDSPAGKAGLEKGDVIVEIDGSAATSRRRVVRSITRRDPGEIIDVVVLRDGERHTIRATLGEREERVERRRPRGRHRHLLPHIARPRTPDVDNLVSFFSRPRLGVETRRIGEDLAPYFDVEAGTGVLVLEVIEDTPAEEAGLRAGDVILRVDEERVDSPGALRDLLLDFEGEEVTLDVKRRGESLAVEVTLDEPPHTWLGRPGRGRASMLAIPGSDSEALREELEELREELRALERELGELRDSR